MASVTPSPTILVPHLPPKTLVGIDLITFTSTSNFHGIRDLPTGWHFLYSGATESLSLRSGGWFYVGDISAAGSTNNGALIPAPRGNLGPDVIIWKWDTDTETLSPLRASDDADKQEAMRHKANLAAVWQSGGLFRYRSRVPPSSQGQAQLRDVDDDENEEEGREDWEGLTNRLSPRLLKRIIGDPEVDVDGRPRWMVTSASTAQKDSESIPGIPEPGQDSDRLADVIGEQESEFSFLNIDLKKTWREGAIGRERTEAAQDRSWALGDLIQQVSSADQGTSEIDERLGEAQILGELQFTFLMVLTLMNFSCLQQWKRLLGLIFTCQRAIKEREQFISNVLRLLLVQLRRCDDIEGGFFDLDGEEGGEFLRKLLMKFRTSLYEVIEDAGTLVKEDFKELESWVKTEYDWELNHGAFVRRGMLQLEDGEQVEMDMPDDEDDEMGEYAPVVVDLGEGNTM
ncbi:A1 cistron-splicing factor [Aspergillus transmontanensis]|uniref:A1 cistron-splicing factor n=1 Tax=Aspergillus transmontanensis TaxID=1034304 RepID=A0A5N6WAF6_9EURO|nr:A1 cistron-splicing factor [Aspergillus transmontanensis]